MKKVIILILTAALLNACYKPKPDVPETPHYPKSKPFEPHKKTKIDTTRIPTLPPQRG